ncbi:MAG: hypothetical protein K0U54_08855, partial [Bacteroidetes bacterium]|nr:hypothetical protein [Bacteroidota bacterium]
MNEYNHCKLCDGAVTMENKKYNLGRCRDCGFVFCLTQFTQEEFIKTYDDLYNSLGSSYARHSVNEFELLKSGDAVSVGHNRSRLIKKHVLNGKTNSVLEIGSGVGLVGTYVTKANPDVYYQGIEI